MVFSPGIGHSFDTFYIFQGASHPAFHVICGPSKDKSVTIDKLKVEFRDQYET